MYYSGNSPLFFVPSYPTEKEMRTDNEPKYEMAQKELYQADEALEKGNIFKDEYKGYKNYIPAKLKAKKEQQMLLMNIQAYSGAAHDLELYLDIYPTDKKILDLFVFYSKKAKELLDEYNKKYETLSPSTAIDKNGTFSYVLTPSVWLKM